MAMSDANQTTTGWVIFMAAMGMMLGMLAIDIAALNEWSQMQTPTFVGTALGHIAATIAAFVGGKLIPADRGPSPMTRSGDPKQP